MKNKLDEINELLKTIENCFEEEVGYKINKLNDKIRIRTPFLYKDNDFIELYIYYANNFIWISDLGLTAEKFLTLDKDLLSILIKNISLSLDTENLYVYKKFSQLNKTYSLMRKIIDFANNLQRLETLYKFLLNFNNKSIEININQNIYVKSNKNKIEKVVLKDIKKDINKNLLKTIKKFLINNKYKLLYTQNFDNNPLRLNFIIKPE